VTTGGEKMASRAFELLRTIRQSEGTGEVREENEPSIGNVSLGREKKKRQMGPLTGREPILERNRGVKLEKDACKKREKICAYSYI